MQKLLFSLGAALVLAVGWHAAPARAQATRTFVSGDGADSNPCTFTAPCRSFAQAISVTAPNGEITILTPAGYGPVTITHGITINNGGVGEAGVTQITASPAITINAGPNDVINLIGLTLVGQKIGTDGILFNTGGTLNIQQSTIGGFVDRGINITSTDNMTLNVADTIIIGNGLSGIFIEPSGSASASVVLKRIQTVENGLAGVKVQGFGTAPINVTFADSVANANNVGLLVITSASGQPVTNLIAQRSEVTGSTTDGLQAQGTNASIFLAQSTVVGNATAFSTSSGGVVNTYENNYVAGNVNPGSALTPVTFQ